jgi:uncharacterized protein YjiS (DUF1127 family)
MTTVNTFRNTSILVRSYQTAGRTLSHFARRLVYRRTLSVLDQLDDRMLRDIGLTRADLDGLRSR